MSRGTQGQRQESSPLSYGAITLYGVAFQRLRSAGGFVTPWGPCRNPRRALQPPSCNGCTLATGQVWAVPLSLATTQGIVSFPRGTKMFQFPRCPPTAYGFSGGSLGMNPGGLPHSVISGSKPARRLPGAYCSHATTFIGLWRQGIHHVPLVACPRSSSGYIEDLPLRYSVFNVPWSLTAAEPVAPQGSGAKLGKRIALITAQGVHQTLELLSPDLFS